MRTWLPHLAVVVILTMFGAGFLVFGFRHLQAELKGVQDSIRLRDVENADRQEQGRKHLESFVTELLQHLEQENLRLAKKNEDFTERTDAKTIVIEKEMESMKNRLGEIATLCKAQEDLLNQSIGKATSSLEKIDELKTCVNQQTSVLHRALGKQIPMELPSQLHGKLDAMEVRVKAQADWPATFDQAKTMADELGQALQQIPPWAEEDLLPQLNRLRWGVQTLLAIRAKEGAKDQELERAIETYTNLLSAKPGGLEALEGELETRKDDALSKSNAARRAASIRRAEQMLDKETSTAEELAEAWQSLAEWTSRSEPEQPKQLRQKLRARLLSQEVKTLRTTMKHLEGVSNETLCQTSYIRLFENTSARYMSLFEQVDVPPEVLSEYKTLAGELEAKLKDQATKVAKRQAEFDSMSVQEYQKWALRAISTFNSDYEIAIHQIVPGTIYSSTVTNYWMVRQAIVQNLSPISSGYLEPSVMKLFNDAFEKGWKKLEDKKPEQTGVAQDEVTIRKKTPADFGKRK